VPKCDAPGRLEEFTATMTGNREDGPCLSEVMGARETST